MDRDGNLSDLITFSSAGISSQELKAELAESGINVAIGRQQARPIYMGNNNRQSLVQASLHYHNTQKEITRFADKVNACIHAE